MNLPEAITDVLVHCLIVTSAKELLEIRLLAKKYQFIHKNALVNYRKLYFKKKLKITKTFLENQKKKALKNGKRYREPGVYIVKKRVRHSKFSQSVLTSIYRCRRCTNTYKDTNPIFQFKYRNRCMCEEEVFLTNLK
jgi:hypothetical protein